MVCDGFNEFYIEAELTVITTILKFLVAIPVALWMIGKDVVYMVRGK